MKIEEGLGKLWVSGDLIRYYMEYHNGYFRYVVGILDGHGTICKTSYHGGFIGDPYTLEEALEKFSEELGFIKLLEHLT